MKIQHPDLVRLASTPEDRADRVALGRRAGLHGKTHKQVRSNDRRKAIRDSREGA